MMFDRAKEYDKMLHMGLNLSGEDKHFFIQGRLQDLYRQLPIDFYPSRILDFGCGIGDTTKFLAEMFPNADIIGVDSSDEAITHAHQTYGSARISFYNLCDFTRTEEIDLCYTNGVFHHIIPDERVGLIARIHRMLRPGGYFALFENNPWNPGTRLVMKRIPFDREAQLLSIWEANRLLQAGGFSFLNLPRCLFYFPRSLAWLRCIEPFLARFPLGGQYYILAQKKR